MRDFVRLDEVLFALVSYLSLTAPSWRATHNTVKMTFYYVYVLLSERDKKLYIGFSRDVFKRLEQHNAGQNISTMNRIPLRLIYFEAHLVKEDALRRESYFKTASGKRTLQIVLKNTLRNLGYRSSSTNESPSMP